MTVRTLSIAVSVTVLLAGLLACSVATAQSASVQREGLETQFNQALQALLQGDTQQAATLLDAIIARHPEFRLARTVRADMFATRAGQLPLLSLAESQSKVRTANLLAEAKQRYTYQADYQDKMPDVIMRLASIHPYALLFDAERSRLYVAQNDKHGVRIVKDYYASHGKAGMHKAKEGDSRTPSGVYKITHSHPDNKLPELYGSGAYVLNYPNKWDRLQGRSGGGIWLHGAPRTVYSRPPLASRGCIVLSNALLSELASLPKLYSTPVVLAQKIDWLERHDWLAKRQVLLDAISTWQNDWQSLDVDKYLSHYSEDYRDKKSDYQKMIATTKRNAEEKTFVKVGIKNIDVMLYSRSPDIMTTYFDQNYQSNNYSIAYRKQQLWRLEDGQWKIIYEGRA